MIWKPGIESDSIYNDSEAWDAKAVAFTMIFYLCILICSFCSYFGSSFAVAVCRFPCFSAARHGDGGQDQEDVESFGGSDKAGR